MAEEISEEQKQVQEVSQEIKIKAEEQLQNQIKTEESEKSQQLKDAAQAQTDKANQELAKIPQKIEDDLDDFNKKLKSLMGKNVSPKVDVNSPDFDIDVSIGDFKKTLDPLKNSISPIETVVGKVPVLGDVMSTLTKLTSNNENGGLTKEEIKALVPNKPEVPQTLLNKIDETCRTIQEFCAELPILLIDVIIQMLVAIYDMFDQIVGIIGVPPAIFPFSLIKQFPTLMPKIKDFITKAPSQIKNIVMGSVKEKFAAAQALSIPKTPEPSDIAKSAKENAVSKPNISQGNPAPEPIAKSPIESPVVETTVVVPTPPEQISQLTWDQVTEKWPKRFASEFNYDEDAVKNAIGEYRQVFNGKKDAAGVIEKDKSYTEKTYGLSYNGDIYREQYSPNNCDRWLLKNYNSQKMFGWISCQKVIKASELVSSASGSTKSELQNLKDKEVVYTYLLKPKSFWTSLF